MKPCYRIVIYSMGSVTPPTASTLDIRSADRLTSLLAAGEVVLSSELTSRAVKQFGINADTARQQVARAARSGRLWRSTGIVLPKNERLVSRRQPLADPQTLFDLAARLKELRPGLSAGFASLATLGVVNRTAASRLDGTVIPPCSEHATSFERTRAAFLDIAGVWNPHAGTALECFTLPEPLGANVERRSRILACRVDVAGEVFIARIIGDILRQQSVVGWNQFFTADPGIGVVEFEVPEVGWTAR